MRVILVIAVIATVGSSAPAQVVFKNYGPPPGYDQSNGYALGSGNGVATGFHTGSQDVLFANASFFIRAGATPNSLSLNVTATAGPGGPPGTILQSIPLSNLPSTATGEVTANAIAPLILTHDTDYWFALLSPPGGISFSVPRPNASPPIVASESFFLGGSWNASFANSGPNSGYVLAVNANPIPEPGSLLLGGMALAGIIAYGRRGRITRAACVGLLLTAVSADAQVVIDTRVGGTPSTTPFGQSGDVPGNFVDDDKNGVTDELGTLQRNHTVGQTFTVPGSAPRLTAFNFSTHDSHFEDGIGVTETPTMFRAYLMAWDSANNRAAGPVLFQSALQSTTEDDADHVVSFSGLGLDFTPGTTYVAFLTQEGFGMPTGNNYFSDILARDSSPGGTYAGGTLVAKTDGTLNFTGLTTESWSVFPDRDAEFFASFTAVPEPSALLLTAPAAIGWVLFWRRRWRQCDSPSPCS